MRWKLFATLAETAGDTMVEVSLDTDEPTLRDALDALTATHPELDAEITDDEGKLHSHVRLLCDGADPFHEAGGWETSVTDIDECALFPPVSGG
ncbi:ubiquitin-like small modifier protein 1 [Halovenus rubra]|uniref:Ubiquitin-like small modifier protein 1 n=2 Tax=Halovenus rubra TaxID=869890 RepID=A0ABD5X1Q2_9EURY|nr:ubiquitin-like small modifier protein 1 [Halovenus rubra]